MLTPNDIPYEVENAALAFSLYQAGVPFADTKEPTQNLYTERALKVAGYGGAPFRELAQKAWHDGVPGRVRYCFKRTDDLQHLIACFDNQKKQLQERDATGAEVIAELSEAHRKGEMDGPEFIVRLTCTMVILRKEFVGMWKRFTPYIQIDASGPVTESKLPDGGKLKKFPGYTIVRVDASDEHLKRMGLK